MCKNINTYAWKHILSEPAWILENRALNGSGSRGLFGVCPCVVRSQREPAVFFCRSNELLICCSLVCVSQRLCAGQTVNPKNKRKL